MGLKIKGLDNIGFMLKNLHKKTTRSALVEMKNGAADIMELAKKQAPFEEGNLEEAIKQIEDLSGVNGRKRISVYVDEAETISGRPGKTVGDYAAQMHEGSYRLGRGSEDKSAANGERVGSKFLERAADDLGPDIKKRVRAAIGRDT